MEHFVYAILALIGVWLCGSWVLNNTKKGGDE